MKRSLTIAVALTLLVSLVTSAAAETTKINKAKVSVWFPDDWAMEKQGTTLVIGDPGEEVALMFLTVPARKLDEALEALDEQIAQFASDVQMVGEPEHTDLNGMSAILVDGKGKAEGKRVDLSVAVVERPGAQALIMLGVIESSKLKKHEKTLIKILRSLRPTR